MDIDWLQTHPEYQRILKKLVEYEATELPKKSEHRVVRLVCRQRWVGVAGVAVNASKLNRLVENGFVKILYKGKHTKYRLAEGAADALAQLETL